MEKIKNSRVPIEVEKSTGAKYLSKIKKSKNGLSEDELLKLRKKSEKLDEEIKKREEELLELGRIIDYDRLKKEGFSNRKIKKFYHSDENTLKIVKSFMEKLKVLRQNLFGYPSNLFEDSAMTKYLKRKEAELPLLNNCGDTYDRGNYQMDSKLFERKCLKTMYKKFNLKKFTSNKKSNDGKPNNDEGAWGYVSTGGSESNKWGIENGMKTFPNGIVYSSHSAHYSVDKALTIGPNINGEFKEIYSFVKIDTIEGTEKINEKQLIEKIEENWIEKKAPAVILLTWGTTRFGSCDDVESIVSQLEELKIPHYIHLDAALFGGIGNNQKDAPIVPSLKELKINSISVSLHKYFGSSEARSILICKERPLAKSVDYIGEIDSTTAGSRSFMPFSSFQKLSEILFRQPPGDFSKNILEFENLLNQKHIEFARDKKSNIFVIDKPSQFLCKKYQLSDFMELDKTGKVTQSKKAHIIIFPYHEKKKLEELVNDLFAWKSRKVFPRSGVKKIK